MIATNELETTRSMVWAFGEYTSNKTMKSYFVSLFKEQSHGINTKDWPNNVLSPLVARDPITFTMGKEDTAVEAAMAQATNVIKTEKMHDTEGATDNQDDATEPITMPETATGGSAGPRPVSGHGRKTPSKSQPAGPKATPSGAAIVDSSPPVKKPKTDRDTDK
jgi:hypothetical protein